VVEVRKEQEVKDKLMSCNSEERRERERERSQSRQLCPQAINQIPIIVSRLYLSFQVMITKLVCIAATNVSCGSKIRKRTLLPAGYTYRVPLEQSTPSWRSREYPSLIYRSYTTTHPSRPALNGPFQPRPRRRRRRRRRQLQQKPDIMCPGPTACWFRRSTSTPLAPRHPPISASHSLLAQQALAIP